MPRPKAKPDNMTEEAKAKRREYYKKWRAANRDKVRASQRRYWERLAARAAAEIAAAGGDPAEDQSGELLEDQTDAQSGDEPQQAAPTHTTLTARGSDGQQISIDPDDMTDSRLSSLVEYKRAGAEGATV